jgi:outer membrane protein assembly factor BamD (BamD/ComL family)
MKVGFLWMLAILTSAHEARGDDALTAEDFYNAGQEAYDHGDYATAIAKWQTSYQLSSADGLLFNIAQAKRLAGDCRGALAEYRRFLAADPGAPQHALATDLASELAERCG